MPTVKKETRASCNPSYLVCSAYSAVTTTSYDLQEAGILHCMCSLGCQGVARRWHSRSSWCTYVWTKLILKIKFHSMRVIVYNRRRLGMGDAPCKRYRWKPECCVMPIVTAGACTQRKNKHWPNSIACTRLFGEHRAALRQGLSGAEYTSCHYFRVLVLFTT